MNPNPIIDTPLFGTRIVEDGKPTEAFHALLEKYEEIINAFQAAEYTVSTVPAAADNSGRLILVADETGGSTIAFSDGTNWRRVQDRAIIS